MRAAVVVAKSVRSPPAVVPKALYACDDICVVFLRRMQCTWASPYMYTLLPALTCFVLRGPCREGAGNEAAA